MSFLTKERPSSVRVVNRDRRPIVGDAIKGALAASVVTGPSRGKYMRAGQKVGTLVVGGSAVGRFTEAAPLGTEAEIQFFSERTLFLLKNDPVVPVVAADIESPCWVLDDQTVTGAQGAQCAGIVYEVTSEGVWIEVADSGLFPTRSGVTTLVAGVASVLNVPLSANSRIHLQIRDIGTGAMTGFVALIAPVSSRNITLGSFVIQAIDGAKAVITTAVCVVEWEVVA